MLRRIFRERLYAAPVWEERSFWVSAPSACDRGKGRRQERRNGHGDENIRVHNTLSAESTEVQVFYPFHPLYGSTLQILRRPERGDGAVCVMDRAGKRLKIPVWMLLPDCTGIKISDEVHLSKASLLSLASLLSPHVSETCVHDNLLATAVDGCKGGHRGSATNTGSDDPGRKRNRANGCDSARRSGRPDGSHSGSGLSSRRRGHQ